MINSIQVLRGYSALMVAYYHTAYEAVAGIHAGFIGVPIFFVISGYVMALTIERDDTLFFTRRILRIAPSYWLATFVVVYLFGRWSWHSPRDVVLSLLFIPHVSQGGSMEPTLGVGWTLNIEMYFYALLALALLISRKNAARIASVAIVVVMLVMWVSGNPLLQRYYGSNYVLFFVAGVMIYEMRYWISSVGVVARGSISTVFWSALVAVTIISITTENNGITDILFIAAPVVLVALAVMVSAAGRDNRSRFWTELGDASYMIYLIHTIALEWIRHRYGIVLSGNLAGVLIYLVAVSVVGIALHHAIEKPIIGVSKSLVRRWYGKVEIKKASKYL